MFEVFSPCLQFPGWRDSLRRMPAEPVAAAAWTWLSAGRAIFPAMLAAIDTAQASVCLEIYTYSADALGERFLEALVRARKRGARVRVLVDALGSIGLPAAFWKPLRAAGGGVGCSSRFRWTAWEFATIASY
jgi:cardiolipin synthase